MSERLRRLAVVAAAMTIASASTAQSVVGGCHFNAAALSFVGTAAEQAQCLLRPIAVGGVPWIRLRDIGRAATARSAHQPGMWGENREQACHVRRDDCEQSGTMARAGGLLEPVPRWQEAG